MAGRRAAYSGSELLGTVSGAHRRRRATGVAAYRNSGNDAAPVFSPDGKSVFLCRAPGELIRIDLATGAIEAAGLNLPALQSLQVHPSGRKIFFQAGQGHEEIWIAENILPRNAR